MQRQRGFSLVQTMVVLAVVSTLAVIAVPRFQKYHRGAQAEETKRSIERLLAGAKTYYIASAKEGSPQLP